MDSNRKSLLSLSARYPQDGLSGDWSDLIRHAMAITRYTDDEGNHYELDSQECGFSCLSVVNAEGVKMAEMRISNQTLVPLLADLIEVVEQ